MDFYQYNNVISYIVYSTSLIQHSILNSWDRIHHMVPPTEANSYAEAHSLNVVYVCS